MRRYFAMTIAAGLVCLLSTTAVGQDQWVRGKVSAISDTSITLSVKGKDMTFAISDDARIVAPGGGTAQRQAEAAGKSGIKASQVIKVGTGAEVHYVTKGGAMQATEIRGGLPSTTGASDRDSGKAALGTVSAVTGTELTIKVSNGTQTFTIDSNTEVVGRGLGTMGREKKAEGKGLTITDAVKVGDRVTVMYHETGGKAHASQVRVSGRPGT